jgi:single-strand selective monofunctional uracil DNA glycosylase
MSGERRRGGALVEASRTLAAALAGLQFDGPVCYVYNPLLYARRSWEAYLTRYGNGPRRVVFVGMNPGPWGMAQTGVPFGEVRAVRDWLGIEEPVGRPPEEHPRRRVDGFAVTRSEASGLRLWGLMRARFGTPEAFFAGHFVANYCPLLFLDDEGRNLTPEKLHRKDRERLFPLCDEHLRRVVGILEPEWLLGVGRFTEGRVRELYGTQGSPRVAGILHPSPASPRANRGWAEEVTSRLVELGIW